LKEKEVFFKGVFSLKPVCPCPTAGGPTRRQAGTGREERSNCSVKPSRPNPLTIN